MVAGRHTGESDPAKLKFLAVVRIVPSDPDGCRFLAMQKFDSGIKNTTGQDGRCALPLIGGSYSTFSIGG
jgi:hypothetical protein